MLAADESPHIYRCGQAYTNQPEPGVQCKVMHGAPITVIEGTRVQGAAVGALATGPNAGAKVDVTEQRQRDVQAYAVLQAELQKAQTQYAQLQREWNKGEPERRADEFRQPQKYQDRVQQLRAAMQRAEADVAGLQRELSRLSANATVGVKP